MIITNNNKYVHILNFNTLFYFFQHSTIFYISYVYDFNILFNFLTILIIYLLKVNKILFNVFGEIKKKYLHKSHVCEKLNHLKASYFQINNIQDIIFR